jgi:hypothetical protein
MQRREFIAASASLALTAVGIEAATPSEPKPKLIADMTDREILDLVDRAFPLMAVDQSWRAAREELQQVLGLACPGFIIGPGRVAVIPSSLYDALWDRVFSRKTVDLFGGRPATCPTLNFPTGVFKIFTGQRPRLAGYLRSHAGDDARRSISEVTKLAATAVRNSSAAGRSFFAVVCPRVIVSRFVWPQVTDLVLEYTRAMCAVSVFPSDILYQEKKTISPTTPLSYQEFVARLEAAGVNTKKGV